MSTKLHLDLFKDPSHYLDGDQNLKADIEKTGI
jgi:hypothetical protein